MLTGNESIYPYTLYQRATTDPNSNIVPFKMGGLTLRQHFAGLNMANMLHQYPGKRISPEEMERIAYEAQTGADALIAQLNESK